MPIASQVSTQADSYQESYRFHLKLAEDLERRIQAVRSARLTKPKAPGILSVAERIEHLIDRGSHFFELSALAGLDLYEDEVRSGGLVTGIGLVHGRACMIVANDSSVKGGTYYPITVKKHLRAQQIAREQHLPCLYLVDSGGAFLPLQAEVFPDRDHFGRIFFNQARMSAEGIPQIASVHGLCTAGGAYIPAMSDQSVIVREQGRIFLAGPPLVKAATGEDVTAEELGGAEVHTRQSGVADHLAEDDRHAMSILRQIVYHLGDRAQKAPIAIATERPPLYASEELLGIIPEDPRRRFDIKELLARLLDGSEFFEFKASYGPTLVCGFAHLNGIPIGVIANQGVLFSESALKATHFIELCAQEYRPLLFVQNITGFVVGKKFEHGGIAKDGAKMVHAVATAQVPKLTLIVGGSFGAGNYGMCGRAYDPAFLFAWPNAKTAVMGGEQAADVLAQVKKTQVEKKGLSLSAEEWEALRAPIVQRYQKESDVYYGTARLWDDGVIDPRQTRAVLAQALATVIQRPWLPTKHGIFRM